MLILNDGMSATLTDEAEFDKSVIWEYKFPYAERNSAWRPFSTADTKTLEESYRSGTLYGNGYVYVGIFYVHAYNAEIGDYEVKGFGGQEEGGDYRDIAARRVGDRCVVPNEGR